MLNSKVYDFVIVGSGFGGSVSAMRLRQRGYSVLVLEAGKRWEAKDFPKTNWNAFKYLWAPKFRCFGIQKITLLKGLMLLHGAGVGGGSLVYANTLMKPEDHIFDHEQWPKGISWRTELTEHFETAKKMLGVTTNPKFFESELALKELGKKLNVVDTFHATEVGVYFNEENKAPHDPYFNGEGPPRSGCTYCGGCMIGCRVGAKNTLDRNYLYFAEKWGAEVVPETTIRKITPVSEGYRVEGYGTTGFVFKTQIEYRAKNVIVAAGVMGTLKLLFENRDVFKTLPNISKNLGESIRTNGESLLGATSFDAHRNLSRGIAIGAAIHPNSYTKVESVKYPSGSDFLKFLAVPLTEEGSLFSRPLKLIKNVLLNIPKIIRLHLVKDWAKQTIILLVMQSVDQKINLKFKASIFFKKGKLIRAKNDNPLPSYLPVAQESAKLLAEGINGFPQNVASEVLMGTPATAHILGGACMGENAEEATINSRHEVFNYPGLYVCDGSVIPVNLAVNPSLTITALSERFASKFPFKAGYAMKEEIQFSPPV